MQVAKAGVVLRLPTPGRAVPVKVKTAINTLVIKHSYLGHLAEVGPATRSCLAHIAGELYKQHLV